MPKSRRTGLPDRIMMRHEGHFVDLVTSRTKIPQIRMISVEMIDPNPRQARITLGNIKELMASIREKGILEPILVRPKNGRYEIIAGERRYVASKKIGLKELPCIEMDVEESEAMELALIENLQRKDLDPFEEADGLHALSENYGYNHEKIAKKIGKARSTITETIHLKRIPGEIRILCKNHDISSRSTLLEISKQKSKNDMAKLISEITKRDLKREDTRELSKIIKGKTKRTKNFVFNYSSTEKGKYKLRMEFRKEDVSKDEIIRILREVIDKLRSS